jgi:PAS domain S-box-containing protein
LSLPEDTFSQQAHYRTAFELVEHGVMCIGENRLILQVNTVGRRMLGYGAKAELEGRPFTDFSTPEILPAVDEFFGALMRQSRGLPSHWKVRNAAGDFTHVDVSFRTHTEPNGFKVSVVSFSETALAERERGAREREVGMYLARRSNELRELSKNYRSLLENSQDGVLIVQQGVVLYTNPRFEEMVGRRAVDLISRPSLDLIDPRDHERLLRIRERTMSGERVPAYPIEYNLPNGRRVHTECFSVLIELEGESASMVIVKDVTERVMLQRRLEANLRAIADSEFKYRQIVENAGEAIIVASHERGLIYANPRAVALYQLEEVELKSVSYSDLISPQDRARLIDLMQERSEQHAAHKNSSRPDERPEPFVLRAAGSAPKAEIWHEVSCEVVDWEGGEAFLLMATDITQRRRMEHDTQRALVREVDLSVMKTRFISMASHEFKTPIAIIMSSAELLKHYLNTMTEPERIQALDDIEGATMRMRGMLDDMLLLGRADAGKMRFNPSASNFPNFVDTVVAQVGRIDALTHDIVVSWRQDKRHFTGLLLDETLLHHVLTNLLLNAVKYSEDRSRIDLSLDIREGHLSIMVRDHGIGVPPSDLPRLFESFYRASNVGKVTGTGLGLTIVKRAVDAHNGQISVQSELGKGTSFIIKVPLTA